MNRSTCRTRATCPNPALQPPPICCIPVYQVAAGVPAPVNMAYFGGHVQVTPKIYLVFWGWGQPGAFDHTTPGHADVRPGRGRGTHDRLRQGDGRHDLGGRPDAVLRDGQRAERQHPEPVERLRRGLVRQHEPDPQQRDGPRAGAGGAARGRALRRHRPRQLAVRDRAAADVQRGGLQLRSRLLRLARLHAAAVLPRRPARHLVHEHAVRPQLGHGLRRELRQHRLLRGPARRVHDRRGARDRGDDHRPRAPRT